MLITVFSHVHDTKYVWCHAMLQVRFLLGVKVSLKNNVKKKAEGVYREEVMKVLRKSKIMKVLKQKIQNRRRQRERVTRSLEAVSLNSLNESSSLGSVNNDWMNWVTLNGDEESKASNVQSIGKVIGVSFKGSCHNKFSVLSRHKSVDLGPVLMPVVVGRDEEVEGV